MEQTSSIPENSNVEKTPLICLPAEEYKEKNYYPYARHTILALSVLFALTVIIFLIYHNGKSIYDNGI